GTPYEELRRQLAVQMRRAVERNYEDPERDWIFLSGGKDSRLILSSAAGSVGERKRVQAVSWTSNDPEPGSDVYLARRIAAHLGVSFHEVRRTVEGFGEKALRLTYILDGLTDVGAFHGDELRIMEELAKNGVRRVLRGDQCFTRGRAMASSAYAILRMCIRSTRGLADGRSAWRPEAYRRVCEAGDARLRQLEAEYAEVEENNAGDQVYFRHRLQGYLNSAVYFKHLMLDHRNPLLDEGLLRLIQRLSVAARREQRVLNEAGSLYFDDVWNPFPFAERSNLEDFVDLLSRDTPVRRAVRRELSDNDSPAWELLDRRQLLSRLDALASSGGSAGLGARLKKAVKNTVAKAVYNLPAVDTRLRGVYLAKVTRHDEVLLRALTLKHVFDLFVTGDGSRDAYEERWNRTREETAASAPRPPRMSVGEPPGDAATRPVVHVPRHVREDSGAEPSPEGPSRA
ncbi:MAG: asparagine synthase-related protein, partial [Holophagales bacterium]|nr:asparagine synthase-related protein [Holophagales bacterium]